LLFVRFLTFSPQEVNLVPDFQAKLVRWFQNHVHLASRHKNLKVQLKSTIFPKAEIGTADHSDGLTVSESDITDAVAVKSVPPRRRTKSNIRILRDNSVICSPEEILSANGIIMNGIKAVDQLGSEEPENSREVSIPNVAEKVVLSHCNYLPQKLFRRKLNGLPILCYHMKMLISL